MKIIYDFNLIVYLKHLTLNNKYYSLTIRVFLTIYILFLVSST